MTKARELAELGAVYDSGALSNRNLIINGAMQVWQRGTSVTGAGSSGYSTADRWQHNASGGSLDLSQQSLTLGQTDIPKQIKHFMRVSCTTGNNNAGMWQKVEDVTSAQGTVTVSFYAKGTNPNGGVFELNIRQNYGSSGSTEDEQDETFSVTSSWQRFTFTLNLTSLSGKTIAGGDDYIWVYFRQPSADTSTDAWTLDFTGVQLEVGPEATPFEHRSYGDELARCQRYFNKVNSSGAYHVFGHGMAWNTGTGDLAVAINHPVTMRTTPTLGNSGVSGFGMDPGNKTISAMSLYHHNESQSTLKLTAASGYSTGTALQFIDRDATPSANLTFDAEL